MKLYTEEQVKETFYKGIKYAQSIHPASIEYHNQYVDGIINSLTPIELPSDEEIKTESHNHYLKGQLYIEPASDTEYAFKKGAKWLKGQILNQDK